jgi:hypothetical protein
MTKETEWLIYNEIIDKVQEIADPSSTDYKDLLSIVSASIVFGIEMGFQVDHEHAITNIRNKLSAVRSINIKENVQ